MRLPPLLRLRLAGRPSLGRIATGVLELWLLVLGVQLLEFVGRVAFDDASDVVGVLLLLLMGMMLVGAARAGRAPVSRFVGGAVVGGVRRWIQGLEPAAGVAFRLPADPPALCWTPRAGTLVAVGVLAVAAAAGGRWVLQGLEWTRDAVAYTPYLMGLVLLWSLFGVVTTLGLVAVKTVAGIDRAGSGLGRALRWAPWLLLWLGVIAAFAACPGWSVIAIFLAVAAVAGRPAFRRPARHYWLWRYDDAQRVRATTVLSWLRATWLATVLLLLAVVLLAQLPRLFAPVPPTGRFGITIGLGLAANAAALVLLVHGGRFLARALPKREAAPEAPLDRTLWWPGGGDTPWREAAIHEGGWRIAEGRTPSRGYDLALGAGDDPLAVHVPAELSADDALFRLERRFHVTKRRVFFRRLHTLYKEITKPPRLGGAGYLLCPAAWPVPGVIRDGATSREDGRAVLGGVQVGRPYAEVFPPRVRRYLAGVLAALEIDLIYWEDRVGWAPLRAVLGVLFETYDQGRFPAQERHFVGLTRARVVIQEAEDVDAMLADPLRDPADGPPPLRARVLVIRRDDGGQREEVPDRRPGSRLPVGSPA